MPSEELLLDPVSRSSAVARRWVCDRLADIGREHLGDEVELLVAEVVTNAILHAGTRIRVILRPDGDGVRVAVSDGSTTEPVRLQHSSLATIGRGLGMLDQLSQRWGWTVTSEGKTVWFVVAPVRDGPGSGEVRGVSGVGRVHDEHALVGSVPRVRNAQSWPAQVPESGLGRYAAGLPGEVVEVCLLGLPVRLLVASQEHHDALIREFRLMALAPERPGQPIAGDLAALVSELGVRHAASRARRDREIQDALGAGVLQIDQVFPVPVAAADQLATLVTVLAEADRYCDENLLLTQARPALVRRFSDWYLGQIRGQLAGQPPTPWAGPLTLSSPNP